MKKASQIVSSALLQSKGPPLATPMRAEDTGRKMGKRATTGVQAKGKGKLINLPPEPKKRGRQSIKASMTPAEIAAEVKELLTDLRAAKDVDEKKRIRRALRLRGHRGGLGKAAPSTPKATPVAA